MFCDQTQTCTKTDGRQIEANATTVGGGHLYGLTERQLHTVLVSLIWEVLIL